MRPRRAAGSDSNASIVFWMSDLSVILPGMGTQELLSALTVGALRIEEDAEHTAKAHYNAGARWGRCAFCLGTLSAVLAAVAGGTAFGNMGRLAGGLAAASTVLTAILTFVKGTEKTEQHKTYGGRYLALRKQTRRFREIELIDCTDPQAARTRLLKLGESLDELNLAAPQVPYCDFKKAKKGIDAGEATYMVDEVKK